MTGNRSLDDFLDSGDDEAGENASEAGSADGTEPVDTEGDDGAAVVDSGDDSDGVDEPGSVDDSDGVDEPRTTLRSTPGGVDCPACGARVERQWRDGDRFVCADCKEW